VRRVAEQGDAILAPIRQGVAIDHWLDEQRLGREEPRADIHEIEFPIAEGIDEFADIRLPIPDRKKNFLRVR
jgi:hypothetical protein